MSAVNTAEQYKSFVDRQVEIYKEINSLKDDIDEFMAKDHGNYSLVNLTKIYDELNKSLEHQQVIRRMMHRAMDTSEERWL